MVNNKNKFKMSTQTQTNTQTGTVKFFDNVKGFGFIKDSESDDEYFVHSSGLLEDIDKEDIVSYQLQQGKKGLNAINVKII